MKLPEKLLLSCLIYLLEMLLQKQIVVYIKNDRGMLTKEPHPK